MAHCPANLAPERASLTIYAAYYAANAESDALDAPKAVPSARLLTLTDQVAGILGQQSLAVSSADALQNLDDNFFKAVSARGAKFAPALRDSYLATMDAAANDARYVEADQLGFIDAKLRALKALGGPKIKAAGGCGGGREYAYRCRARRRAESIRALRTGQCRTEYSGG